MNDDTTHPWQPAYDKFNSEILPELQSIGKQIGLDAAAGNDKAKEVIRIYTLLYNSFDPLIFLLLEIALVEYKNSK